MTKTPLKALRTAGPFLLVLLVFFVVDWYRTRQMTTAPVALVPVTTLAGEARDLVELSRSRPVLLYFWATWCGPCKATSPSVQWLARRHQVISVALDSGGDPEIKAYLREAGYDFPVVNDRRHRLADTFAVKVTPTVIILKDGQVSSATVGISTALGLWLRMLLA